MVELKGVINNIHYYIDKYQEDNKILKGRKSGIPGPTVIIGNRKTINMIFNQFRKEKIIRLLNDRI